MERSRALSGRARGAPTGPKNTSSRGRGRGAQSSSSPSSNTSPPNPFEQERLENAAKREQRRQESGSINTRAGRVTSRGRGRSASKSVRFASPIQKPNDADSMDVVPLSPNSAFPSTFGAPSGLTPNSLNSNQSLPGATNSSAPIFGQMSSNIFSPISNNVSKGTTDTQTAPRGGDPSRAIFGSGSIKNQPSQSPIHTVNINLSSEIDALLRKNGIVTPLWPKSPGDPKQKGAVEAFWQLFKNYRSEVRSCLIKNGYLDDPGKPKKLSEAIDFKGTCEDMCPAFEKVTRIVDHDVQNAEKELSLDGKTYWPSLPKMVKALARSAAGQDAPLPEDVRSPAALRRTLDYLIDTVLSTNELANIHGFLWDRTRAIRRDFVFQQSSMTSQELSDQVYCLELITRFHVVALHQMSRADVASEDFSEQQEVEQLGKALLSLIHAYEDCTVQDVHCENEAEFRAYYVLFNSHNTGILETVQDWGWKYWGESDVIRTAVSIVETLQNTWDTHGPLNPQSATDIAQNGYQRFFSIIEDIKVSYTMACFAEIHFNKVRKAALKTILTSYRKQRDQTRDWSLQNLKLYLHFDNEMEVISFGEAYGLHFESLDGQDHLSIDSDESMIDPFPQLKQPCSKNLVERKRGHYSLPEVIHLTVYEAGGQEDNADSLFIPPSPPEILVSQSPRFPYHPTKSSPDPIDDPLNDDIPPKGVDTVSTPDRKEFKDSIPTKLPSPENIPINSFQSHQPATTITNSVAFGQPPILQMSSDLNGSNSATKTSIFDKISSTTRPSTFSFLDGNKAKTPAGPSSGTTPSFSLPTTQVSVAPMQSNPRSTSRKAPLPSATPNWNSSLTESLGQVKKSGLDSKHLDIISSPPAKHVEKPLDVYENDTNSAGRKVIARTINPPTSNSKASSKNPSKAKAVSEKSQMAQFAEWITIGKGGLVELFTEVTVESLLRETVSKYLADEKRRRAEEEDRLDREEAAHFRCRFLAEKYCRKWREIALRLWMKRKGRLAREARRNMAQSLRASTVSNNKNISEELRVSGSSRRRSVGEGVKVTGTKTAAKNGDGKATGLNRGGKSLPRQATPDKPRRSQKLDRSAKSESPRIPKNTREHSHDALRRSLLSDSAFLHGGSRTLLLPNRSSQTEERHQPNGVKTDYFRLKARGITTLPDGTPLANSAAVYLPKKLFGDVGKVVIPKRTTSKSLAGSVDEDAVTKENFSTKMSSSRSEEIEALKSQVKAITTQDRGEKQQSRKRLLDDDEEELFAKAKRIRDQMSEDTDWYRAEIEKSGTRSTS